MESTLFGFTEAQISEFGVTFGIGAFILYMLFIIGELAYKSKARQGRYLRPVFRAVSGDARLHLQDLHPEIVGNLMSQFDNVSVVKAANVYFDGKCVSHTVIFADGSKKTVGVILPASLTFNTGAPEVMETVAVPAAIASRARRNGRPPVPVRSFNVPGNSSFDIEVTGEPYHYVCYFG